MLTTAYLSLGSNVGDKEANIKKALELLGSSPGVQVKKVASFYRTTPLYKPKQDWFINTAAEIETSLNPHELLSLFKDIEKKLGRVNGERWGPRTIDLDLLLFGNDKVCTPDLIVPHPRMNERAFVMVPLAEIAPDLIVPGGCKANDLARLLLRDQFVEKLGLAQGK